MPATVTLYTTTLEHIETLNVTALEHNRQLTPSTPVREELKVSTTIPMQQTALNNHTDLVVHIQAPQAEVDKVCRIDWYELIYYPNPNDGEHSTTKLALHPLHTDAQTIVKAVLNKRAQQEKQTITTDLQQDYDDSMRAINSMLERLKREATIDSL